VNKLRLPVLLILCYSFSIASIHGQVIVHESIKDSLVISEIKCFIDQADTLKRAELDNIEFYNSLEDANHFLSMLNRERAVWFKFTVSAFDSITSSVSLSVPYYSTVSVFVRSEDGTLRENHVGTEDLGNYYFTDNDQRVTELLKDGRQEEVLIRVKHRSRFQSIHSFYVFFATKEYFDSAKMRRRPSKGGDGYLFLLFCGIMMFQGLYVLLQWYLVRKREYFYYGSYIFSVFLYYYLRFSAFYSENAAWALTDASDLMNLNDVLLIIPSILYLLFASSFVDLKSRDKKLYDLFTVVEILFVICVLAQALIWIIPNDLNKMIPIFIVLSVQVPFTIFALIRIARQKRRVAWFLVIGSAVAFVSHLIANLLPFFKPNYYEVISPLQITMVGIIIEVIIFNSGLLFKAKESDRERIEVQKSYINELKSRQALQSEYASMRDKMSSDLHDDVGSSLSSIGIYSYAARENLQAGNTKQATELLENIKRSAEETLNAMSDLVWATNPRNDSNEKLIERIRSFGFEILSAKECKLKMEIDEEFYSIKLNQAERKNILLILKEAINNSAKYSEASLVNLSIKVGKREFLLSLKDNGIGFDPTAQTGGNGMRTMTRRSEELNGNFEIISSDDGTTIIIRIPI
jgi:signal transduction histidine kinase